MTGVLKILVNGVWQDAVDPGPPGVRGVTGPLGPVGPVGLRGAPGDTVPVGGAPGDALIKTGPADFEVGWQGLLRDGPIPAKEMRGPWDGVQSGSYWDVVFEDRDYVLMATATAFATSNGGKYIQIQLDGVMAPTLPTHPGSYIRLYFNVTSQHQAMSTATIDLIGIPPGPHRLSLVQTSGGLSSDGEDWGHLVLFPQPRA